MFWAVLPDAIEAGTSLIGSVTGSGGSDAGSYTTDQLAHALRVASGSDYLAFRRELDAGVVGDDDWYNKRGWTSGDRTPSPAVLAEIIQLSQGGLNGRFNSNETRISYAVAKLVDKYPLGSGAPAPAPAAAPAPAPAPAPAAAEPAAGSSFYGTPYGEVSGELGGISFSGGAGLPPYVYAIGLAAAAFAFASVVKK